jgi:hypothetical protein
MMQDWGTVAVTGIVVEVPAASAFADKPIASIRMQTAGSECVLLVNMTSPFDFKLSGLDL